MLKNMNIYVDLKNLTFMGFQFDISEVIDFWNKNNSIWSSIWEMEIISYKHYVYKIKKKLVSRSKYWWENLFEPIGVWTRLFSKSNFLR